MSEAVRYMVNIFSVCEVINCVWWNSFGIWIVAVSDVFFIRLIKLFDSGGNVICVVCGKIVWCMVCYGVILILAVVFYWFLLIEEMAVCSVLAV